MVKTRIVVDISDAKVSSDPSDVLVTYSLGSCIGVCLYDPVTHIGGMLHYQLPSSKMDEERARSKPLMFADTGMALLLNKMTTMGANKKRMHVRLAGGAAMATGPQGFDIGKRNYLAIRKILWSNGMFINAEDVGGNAARSLYMDMADGTVTVRSIGLEKYLR
ncbi:MAG: chemotaxis protein CheD [Sedimentisphaerales bacterium]|jgi:chemotaxis protein CheD|nr:chemotaxis protein CheD [Sedimentisphaerales bacterium]HNY78039.1 chemotaxis protein CheD [Sedimentisphaerales bacterium]HOC63243.1 chemotaxis protein CheD [Sedimentisphaerales bacterium]HOH64214.1 chemotaxis protein CheD [Sedimentisphaerales bacterium]HPY48692.1 chemotaxis protein CheD [Sedimentisphaerales bacterium]